MTTKNKVSLLQLNDNSIQSNTNSIQSNTHLVFSNQDYRKIFASNVPSSRFEYIENKGVAIKGRVNGAILETKVPIHENKKYHLICEVELLEDDGSGSTIFIGHDTLDKNFKSLRTDTAVTFNYSLADKIHLSDDEPNRTFETVVSGFNSTDDGNNYKFDPSGSYFNIVFYTRDEETDISSVKLLIKRLEIKEFSSIIERDNGNVGIGTTSPSSKLEVDGDFYIKANTSDWSTPQKGIYIRFSEWESQDEEYIQDEAYIQSIDRSGDEFNYYPLIIESSKTVFSNGNVGIGTSAPDKKLSVNGDVSITGSLTAGTFQFGTIGDDGGSALFHSYGQYGVVTGIAIELTEFDDNVGIVFRQERDVADNSHMNTIRSKYGNMEFLVGQYGESRTSAHTTMEVALQIQKDKDIYIPGNVGIGTTSPSAKLHIVDSGQCGLIIDADSDNSNENDTVFLWLRQDGTNSSAKISLDNTAYNGMVIDARRIHYKVGLNREYDIFFDDFGKLGIGTTSPSAKLDVAGTVEATEFDNPSDKRIKTNITDLEDNECLNLVRQLKPVKYQYIDKEERGDHTVYGFIAQDIREVLPYATKTIKEFVPDYYENVKSVQYDLSTISFDISENYDISQNQKIKSDTKTMKKQVKHTFILK